MDTKSSSYYSRPRRRDGEFTRQSILDAAGRIFAKHGYSGTTNHAVCAEAGCSTPSINYYFGGKEGLYEAVLIEAHRQIMDFSELDAAITSASGPEEKLRACLSMLVRTARLAPELWGIPVLLRELAANTEAVPSGLLDAVTAKLALLKALICGIAGVEQDSPEGRQAVISTVTPCMMLIFFTPRMKQVLVPGLEENPEELVDNMLIFVLGGLSALREKRSIK